MVLVLLKDIPMLVCLNRFVIFLILGLSYVNVVDFLFLFFPLVLSLVGFLCYICRFRFCMSFCGRLLFCAISCVKFHSVCFRLGVNGGELILAM